MLKVFMFDKKMLKILMIISLSFVAMIIIVLAVEYLLIDNYVQITATLQRLDHQVEISYVTYLYKGVLFENIRMESYMSGWEVGKSLLGYVNPADPTRFIAFIDMLIIPAVLAVILLACLIIYLPLIGRNTILERRIKNYRQLSYKVSAKLVSVNGWLSTNSGERCRVCASYKGVNYYSPNLIGNSSLLKEQILNQYVYVDLYFKDESQKKYYLDIESINVVTINSRFNSKENKVVAANYKR